MCEQQDFGADFADEGLGIGLAGFAFAAREVVLLHRVEPMCGLGEEVFAVVSRWLCGG
ncbi:hypothetical protein [Amycolatopsis sp. GA6-003]|uniref:hypothetical protein n=1 Tax=Amycolatopsis sp. GA6-003 TaxID=2652444 RepID=UPI00391746FE